MPIYEYQCEACGEKSELMQKISDSPATDCPQCHAPQLKRIMSAAGFQLKGSGWYVTDFRDKGKKPSKEKPQTEAATKTEKKETKGE